MKRNLQVLIVSSMFQPAWEWGGPVRSTWNLSRGLARTGVDVTVLTTNAKPKGIVNVTAERVEEDVRIFTAPVFGRGRWKTANRFGFSAKFAWKMVSQVRKSDIVHINGIWGYMSIEVAFLSRAYGKPLVISPRGSLGKLPLSQKRLKKSLFLNSVGRAVVGKSSGVHFTSDFEKRQAPDWLVGDKGFVVPNPVDFCFKGDKERFRKKIKAAEGSFVLGISGRIHKIKGFDVIIPALGKCRRNDIVLVVFGPEDDSSGPYKIKVEKIAREAGVFDRMTITGALYGQDLADAYAGIDMLAVPSYHENFGMVVVEAASQGTPVMVSDQVALKDWVVRSHAGLVLPLDIEDWAYTLDELKREDITRRWEPDRLSKITRETFSIETVARQMLREYEAILKDWKWKGAG